MERYFYKEKDENGVLNDMKAMHNIVKRRLNDPETALKLAAAYPDFLRAAIALSKVSERAFEYGYGQEAHEKILKGLAKPGELDALIEIMNSKFRPPHHIVKQFAYPEELEALYKVHKRFIDMFPHLFEEKKSPFEEFIPEDRRKELDEIIELENKLAEAVIQGKLKEDHIIPERKYGKLIQLKKEHYKDALRALEGSKTDEVGRRGTSTGSVGGSRPSATESKVGESPRSKTVVLALFNDRALAEEYAGFIGGRAIQVGSSLWRVEMDRSKWEEIKNSTEKRGDFIFGISTSSFEEVKAGKLSRQLSRIGNWRRGLRGLRGKTH